MDGFNWDGADVAVNTSASWGSNPQESLMMQNSGGFTFVGGKVVHPEDIFTSIQLLQKTGYSSHCNSIMSDRIISHLIQHSAPASDPTQVNIPSWSFSQQEQPFKLADDDNVPRQSSGAEISPPSKLKSTGFINQLNGLFSDYGMENKSMIDDCLREAKAGLIAAATGSTESIDCLLSASDSIHTETSIEDDADISMLFSDCKSLWNFNALNAGSSGESACASSNAKDRKNHNHMNELDETASPTSSGHQIANQAKSSGGITGHKAIKRGSETLLKNLVDQSDTSNIAEASFLLISENQPKPKKPRSEKRPTSSNINFQQPSSSSISSGSGEPDSEAIAQMKEMIYRAAAFRPVNFGTEIMEKPKRKNVRISTDPQTVAARQRRERISERIRVLQRLVPGGSKMDTASMLDEAANYLKFLRSQVKALEAMGPKLDDCPSIPFNHSFPMASNFSTQNPNYVYHPKI